MENERTDGRKDCWVSPTGKVTQCAFAQHELVAHHILKENGWYDEYRGWELRTKGFGTDYLQNERKYIRYCDWGPCPGWVTNDSPPTKMQAQRMFEIDNE